MSINRVDLVQKRFRDTVLAAGESFHPRVRLPGETLFPGNPLTLAEAVEIFECQLTSRWIDYVARELKRTSESFYTIGSAGHEGNAMVGQLTRHTDPAFLHYRSGGFFLARARQVPGQTPIFDVCLGITAAVEDPISGGRHKVWGSKALNVPPQTSTIASHLPKAMGMAFFLDRRKTLGLGGDLPADSIVVCSFGDASANHSTAQGAFNAAAWGAYQHLPVPVLFVCEDNGVGISVHTPRNWIEANFSNRCGMTYFQADGLDLAAGYGVVAEAVRTCRERRRPVFLHLKTVRLLGHAGSDPELTYHTEAQIEAVEARDPLLQTAMRLMECGALAADEILAMNDRIAQQVRAAGREASSRRKHDSPQAIMAPLSLDYRATPPLPAADPAIRARHWNHDLPEARKPRPMAMLINWGLQDLMLANPEILLFGEDVAKKGGVYNVTNDLENRFKGGRVFNTLLDEQSILGLAIGAGQAGLLPIPEIQYLAYLHNAIDQLRGEACSLKFFSEGQFTNPMVVRIAGFAYQKGFGGHFHNDNSFAALRDIPSIILVTASNGADAVRLMRTCVALAKHQGAVVVFVEPIALYPVKALVAADDWSFNYPEPGDVMAFGEVGEYGPENAEILIISYANGTYLSRQAAADLESEGIALRLLDLRFLTPLNRAAIVAAARDRRHIVIVDECRRTGSISEEIATLLMEAFGSDLAPITRICGEDSFIPLGTAWECLLPSRERLAQTIRELAAHG